MATSSIDREKQLLEYLQEHGRATIQDLVGFFGVSNMTIHRDLNKLEKAGFVQKKHGGVVLASDSSVSAVKGSCAMCNKSSSERTIFLCKQRAANKRQPAARTVV